MLSGRGIGGSRTQVAADRVRQEIARLAFVDARKLLDDDAELLLIHQLDDDTAAGIAGLETATEHQRGDAGGARLTAGAKPVPGLHPGAALEPAG